MTYVENLESQVEGDEDETTDTDGSEDENTEVEQGAKEEPAKPAEEADKGTPEPEEPVKPSLTDFDVEEILGDERVKTTLEKMVQSAKDKELAKERRKNAEERARRDAAERERIRQEERQRFEEEQDYEGLYSWEREQEAKAKEKLEQAKEFTDALIGQARQKYDPVLGEDVVERILQETRSQGGMTAVDFTDRLAEEKRRTDVANATADARKSIPDLVAQEVEAKLVELGLKKRAEKVEQGQVPAKAVSADSRGKASQEDMTYEKASQLYGDGEMSYQDFKPFRDEHMRKRQL